MSWRENFDVGYQTTSINCIGCCQVIFVSRGIYKIIEVSKIIKLDCLGLDQTSICTGSISCKLDTITLSHWMINCAQYIILWLKFNMKIKILHFNSCAMDISAFHPAHDDCQFTIL
jgi:hypothetical protein